MRSVSDSDDAIVFAVDFSEMTDFVVDAAVTQARLFERPEVHAVAVLEISGGGTLGGRAQTHGEEIAELTEALEARIANAFEAAGHPLDAPGDWEIEVHVRSGNPAREIAALARELRAGLIVVGRHGHSGPRDFIVGTVPSRLLQLARCDVLVVQPSDYPDDEE